MYSYTVIYYGILFFMLSVISVQKAITSKLVTDTLTYPHLGVLNFGWGWSF